MNKNIKIIVMVFALLGIGLINAFAINYGYNAIKTKAVTDFITKCEDVPDGLPATGCTRYFHKYGIEKVYCYINEDSNQTILVITKEEE